LVNCWLYYLSINWLNSDACINYRWWAYLNIYFQYQGKTANALWRLPTKVTTYHSGDLQAVGARQVVTIMKLTSIISFLSFIRHHVFIKTSHKDVQLAEVGPRFEMRRKLSNHQYQLFTTLSSKFWSLSPWLTLNSIRD